MHDDTSKRVDMICRAWEERRLKELREAEERAAQAAAKAAPPKKMHVTYISRKDLHH
jgi:hypothetical protein